MTYYVSMSDMKSCSGAGPMAAKSGYILTVSFAVTILVLSLISVQSVSITPGFVAKTDLHWAHKQVNMVYHK